MSEMGNAVCAAHARTEHRLDDAPSTSASPRCPDNSRKNGMPMIRDREADRHRCRYREREIEDARKERKQHEQREVRVSEYPEETAKSRASGSTRRTARLY
jgi:hypothetical protein